MVSNRITAIDNLQANSALVLTGYSHECSKSQFKISVDDRDVKVMAEVPYLDISVREIGKRR